MFPAPPWARYCGPVPPPSPPHQACPGNPATYTPATPAGAVRTLRGVKGREGGRGGLRCMPWGPGAWLQAPCFTRQNKTLRPSKRCVGPPTAGKEAPARSLVAGIAPVARSGGTAVALHAAEPTVGRLANDPRSGKAGQSPGRHPQPFRAWPYTAHYRPTQVVNTLLDPVSGSQCLDSVSGSSVWISAVRLVAVGATRVAFERRGTNPRSAAHHLDDKTKLDQKVQYKQSVSHPSRPDSIGRVLGCI